MVGGVVCLLAAMWLQLAFSTHRNSITWDEDDHIFAGYRSLTRGDFGLNPEHPPLVKMLAALPLLDMKLKVPEPAPGNFKLEAFRAGRTFLFQNDADAILFRARLAVSVLTILLALLVFLAAREMFGTGAGFIALGLVAFDPNVLAHGAVVGTDMGLSCFLFGSVYAFYRYVKAPSWRKIALTGVAAGCALASKHTAILVIPILFLLAACDALLHRDEGAEASRRRMLRLAGAFVLACAIAVGVLWAFYGFRYSARGNGLAMNPAYTAEVATLSRPHDIWILDTVGKYKLLPESYLYGLADVRYMSDFYTSFLLGKVYPRGVWFYFPVAMAIKSTLTFLILLGVAIWVIATRKMTKWREILFLTVPVAVYLFVAMTAGMNIGLRHVLPVYFLLYVLLAGCAWTLAERNRRWLYAVIALIAFQAVSGARTYPAYMAYANELWGGPTQTYKYLTDSNADWGQQLHAVKKYLDDHGIKECWFGYFAGGVVDASYYGIPCKLLPSSGTLWDREILDVPPVIEGTVLVSAGDWSGFEFGGGELSYYEPFQKVKPVALIEYGVLVYQGKFSVPLAAATGHRMRASKLLAEGRTEEALTEAQTAVDLMPRSASAQAVLGKALEAAGRKEEARAAYAQALTMAKTVQPEFQTELAEAMEKKLAGN